MNLETEVPHGKIRFIPAKKAGVTLHREHNTGLKEPITAVAARGSPC